MREGEASSTQPHPSKTLMEQIAPENHRYQDLLGCKLQITAMKECIVILLCPPPHKDPRKLYANNSQRCCLTFAMVSVTTGPGRSHYGDENSSKERLRIGSGNPLAQVLDVGIFLFLSRGLTGLRGSHTSFSALHALSSKP